MNDVKETVVRLMDGKYELRHEHGRNFRALRYGEPWRDLTGDGMVLALVQRIEELEGSRHHPPEPGARVTEAMVERYKVLHQEGMDRHVETERAAGRKPQLQSAIDAGIRHALAALSPEPAAQGEEWSRRMAAAEAGQYVGAGAHGIEDRPAPPAQLPEGWRVLQIGAVGSAYDPPNTRRAFTYDFQPGNGGAWALGKASSSAAKASAGDYIDGGLNLLKALQEQGFGVFQIEQSATPVAPAERVPDGWKLAMWVLQSDLYRKLPEEERAVCDALIAENPYINLPAAPAEVSATAWCPKCAANQPHHTDPDSSGCLHLCDVCNSVVEY